MTYDNHRHEHESLDDREFGPLSVMHGAGFCYVSYVLLAGGAPVSGVLFLAAGLFAVGVGGFLTCRAYPEYFATRIDNELSLEEEREFLALCSESELLMYERMRERNRPINRMKHGINSAYRTVTGKRLFDSPPPVEEDYDSNEDEIVYLKVDPITKMIIRDTPSETEQQSNDKKESTSKEQLSAKKEPQPEQELRRRRRSTHHLHHPNQESTHRHKEPQADKAEPERTAQLK